MKINISKEMIDRCKLFAQECAPTNAGRYKFRNQKNPKQIEKQIFIGKMGEVAACEYLKSKGYTPSREPDFEIYKGKKKSWIPDMTVNEIPVHIKSQEMWSAKKYGFSWMFQLSSSRPDGEDYDVLLKTPDGILVFCTVDNNDVEIQCVVAAEKCIPSLLKEPVVPMLRNFKRAIYLEDLQNKFKDKIISLEILDSENTSG